MQSIIRRILSSCELLKYSIKVILFQNLIDLYLSISNKIFCPKAESELFNNIIYKHFNAFKITCLIVIKIKIFYTWNRSFLKHPICINWLAVGTDQLHSRYQTSFVNAQTRSNRKYVFTALMHYYATICNLYGPSWVISNYCNCVMVQRTTSV